MVSSKFPVSRVVLFYILSLLSAALSSSIHQSSVSSNNSPFSRDGRIIQVENARKAALRGRSLLAACAGEEVVLVSPTRKEIHLLEEKPFSDKVMRINEGSYLAISGLAGDGRALANALRIFSLSFWRDTGIYPTSKGIAQALGKELHEASLSAVKRPYAIQSIVIGCSEDQATEALCMYEVDLSGAMERKKVVAIGQYSDYYLEQIEKHWPADDSDLNSDTTTSLLLKIYNEGQKRFEEDEEVTYDVIRLGRVGGRIVLIKQAEA